jgi:MtfA peptidase
MIPDTRRIRATRRWALGEASVVGILLAIIIVCINASGIGCLAALGAAGGLAVLIYRSETRILRHRIRIMERPFPDEWDGILRRRVPYYARLQGADLQRFQRMMAIFLDEKPIHGIGCAVDATCRLLIAASAIIPVFSFPAWEYSTLRKILVRPEPFDADFTADNEHPTWALGMVGNSGMLNGIMILSRAELLAGFSETAGKHHVGIHEFAHLIDQSDGIIDGIPATLPRECLRPWTTLVHEHLLHHQGAGTPTKRNSSRSSANTSSSRPRSSRGATRISMPC